METIRRRYTPAIIRSRLALEVASELIEFGNWPYKQVKLSLRDQGSEKWGFTFFGSDSPTAIEEVASGKTQIAIINPSMVATLAERGNGPFKRPIALRAITVIPDFDQLGFAVLESTGLRSLEEVRERRYPLRVSLRGQRDHSVHLVVNEVLSAAGFSLDDIVAWGGQVRYDPGLPGASNRMGAVERGEADAIFDEAFYYWANKALEIGMRFLTLGAPLLEKLVMMGFRPANVDSALVPKLSADFVNLDFSGYLVYTHADVPEEMVQSVCAALEARKDRIPRATGDGPLPLDIMCRDTVAGPIGIPLHPAAEEFWHSKGYLD